MIIIGLVIGAVLGVVLKRKGLFYTFLTLELIYILFAPKSLIDYGRSGLNAMLGMSAPGTLLLAMIATVLLYGLLFVVIIKQIIISIKHISETKYKVILGVNIFVIFTFIFWVIGLVTIAAGLYRVPAPYPLGLYGTIILITVGVHVFDSTNLVPAGLPKIDKSNLSSIGKKKNISIDRYINNRDLLEEHRELGVIDHDTYQQILIQLVLAETAAPETKVEADGETAVLDTKVEVDSETVEQETDDNPSTDTSK